MTKLLLTGVALIAVWSLAYTPALTDPATGVKSLASRTAACRADCSTDGLHGFYRARVMDHPTPMSTDWGTIYSECVRTCLAPLPAFYVQRPILESGGIWFGKSAASCLECHAIGPNLRVP
jgi:hypothetical protein